MPGESPSNANVFNSMVGSSSPAPSSAPSSSPPASSSPAPTPGPTPSIGSESRQSVEPSRNREVVDSKVDPSKSSSEPAPVKKFKVQGKEYTQEEIASNPDLLNAIFSGYTKQSSLQKKLDQQAKEFQSLTEQHQQAQAALQQQQQQWADRQAQLRTEPQTQGQQSQSQQLTPQTLAQYYGPVAQQTAEQGFLEPDFVAAYPNLSANMMFMRDMLYDAREAIRTMGQHLIHTRQEGQRTQYQTQMEGLRTNVVDHITSFSAKDEKGSYIHGEEFAPLADAGVRQGFIDYLREIKAPVQMVLQNPDFLRNHWFAYNAPVIQEAQRQMRDAEKRSLRTRATGEGTAYHPGASTPNTNPVFDQMMEFGINKLASKSNF